MLSEMFVKDKSESNLRMLERIKLLILSCV